MLLVTVRSLQCVLKTVDNQVDITKSKKKAYYCTVVSLCRWCVFAICVSVAWAVTAVVLKQH